MAQGRFIVIEGLDGAGTTTQANLLKQSVAKRGLPVHLTWEPTAGPIGSILRLILAGRVVNLPRSGVASPPGEAILALLFAADRLDHLDNDIGPRLIEGTHVVCDRYYLSSLAYQTLGDGLAIEWVRQLNARCMRPDLTIFVDTAPDECLRRIHAQGRHLELYEELNKLEKVRQNYLRIVDILSREGENIRVVDGEQPVDEVAGHIAEIAERLNLESTDAR